MKPKEVAIIFHADPDGIIAAANIVRALGAQPALFPVRDQRRLPLLLKRLKGRYGKLYVLDITPEEKAVRGVAERLTIIDHHEGKPVIGKGIVHLNPRFSGKPPYPACYQTFVLLGGLDWQAFVGVVDDWAAGMLPSFANRFWKDYGWVGTQENLYLFSDAGRIGAAIEAGVKVFGEVKGGLLGVQAMLECGTPRQFLDGKGAARRLLAAKKTIDRELKKAVKMEESGKLLIAEVSSRYNIKREVIQRLKIDNPEKTVFVFQKVPGGYSFSGRSPEGVNIREAVGKYGGGHTVAAGGFVPAKEKADFVSGLRVLFS